MTRTATLIAAVEPGHFVPATGTLSALWLLLVLPAAGAAVLLLSGKRADKWGPLLATGLCVAAWGYFLYQGVVDPLGGINTLWPLFGIANQMLAGIALSLGTAVLFKMKRGQYAWVTIVPTVWLLICTLTAGWMKIFDANVKVAELRRQGLL